MVHICDTPVPALLRQALHSAEPPACRGVQGASGEPGAAEAEGFCGAAADDQGSTPRLPEGAGGA